MTYTKHLSNYQHSRTKRSKPRVSRVQPTELDPITTDGQCDGEEAGRLLARYGVDAVDLICERVAKYGGRCDE